jgi:hypothetical protein
LRNARAKQPRFSFSGIQYAEPGLHLFHVAGLQMRQSI